MSDRGLNPMSQGGMYEITLAASGTVTLDLPKGAITIFCVNTAYVINVYSGNNTNGSKFILMMGNKAPVTIEKFKGGLYTFEEPTGGAPVTLYIWSQGLEESL